MYRIDLNCDLGEGFGVYQYGCDEDLLRLITSANIACGFHAGDYNQMSRIVKLCLANNVAIGAHPGYPDLAGFGRRAMDFSGDEIKNIILYQVGALTAIAASIGGRVEHVKPHGELYNSAVRNPAIAGAVIDAVVSLNGPALVVLAGCQMVQEARSRGVRVIEEGFADRRYQADGTLVSRKIEQALITDPAAAAEQALKMATAKKIVSLSGEEIGINVETICIHGDTANSVSIAKAVKQILLNNGVRLAAPGRRS